MKTGFIGLIIVWSTVSFGQIQLKTEFYGGMTDRAFPTINGEPEQYTSLSTTLHRDWMNNQSGLRLSYKGNLTAYRQIADRRYHHHDLGIQVYHLFNDRSRLDAGISGARLFRTGAYEWTERHSWTAFLRLKHLISDQVYLYLGGALDRTRYHELSPFSNDQGSLYIRMSRFFNSGTTLIGETDWMFKTYQPEHTVALPAGFGEIVTIGSGSAQQLVTMLRLAQSLGTRTGISLEALYRHNLTSMSRYMGSTSGIFYSDNMLFDDIFGYNSLESTLTLKTRLPGGFNISTSAGYKDKSYALRQALDLNGTPFEDGRLRSDHRITANLTLSKAISLSDSVHPLTVSLYAGWVTNRSNDPYYDYSSTHFSFGLSYGF
jgi:hypothetical protein